MHDEWQRDRRLIGRVESRRSSDLGFEIGGTLIELQVDEGHTVAAGDPLGRIDDARLAAQAAEVSARLQQAQATLAELIAGTRPAVLEQAKAQVLLAEASRDLAAANLRRSEELHARDALSTQQLDESRFNVASAEAEVQLSQWRLTELERGPRQETILAQRAVVASLEKQVAQIAVDQEKTYLKAPFDGIVARRFRDEGEVVAAGTPVLQVLESSAPRIRLGVPPALVETINQHAQGIKITYQSHSITARLDNWLPDRDPATRTHVALLTIELPSEKSPTLLTSGDLVTALVPMPITTHGVRVPLDALREGERGTWNSLVAVPQKNAPHILESRPVLVVHTDGESAIVRGALNPGELLVTDGLHRVTPGMHVRVATTNSQQESLTAEVGIR
jgi:multidrug efflux pump subunit AcrA (membrane-fusion protein)